MAGGGWGAGVEKVRLWLLMQSNETAKYEKRRRKNNWLIHSNNTHPHTRRCMIAHERNQLGEKKMQSMRQPEPQQVNKENCSWAFFSHQDVWEQHIQSTQKQTEALTSNTESTSWLQQRERGEKYRNVLRKTKWSLNNKQVVHICSPETAARCHRAVCCHYWITIICCLHTCIIMWLIYNNENSIIDLYRAFLAMFIVQ